jgi:hypothetical protein
MKEVVMGRIADFEARLPTLIVQAERENSDFKSWVRFQVKTWNFNREILARLEGKHYEEV